MQSREVLLNRGIELEKLRKLRETVDPASGISLMIRRGPLHQDEEGEARNQWINLEYGGELTVLLDHLIARQEASFKYWKSAVRRDIEDAQHALAAAEKIPLESDKQPG